VGARRLGGAAATAAAALFPSPSSCRHSG